MAVAALAKPAPPSTTPVPFSRDGVHAARMFSGGLRDRESEMRAIESNGLLFSIVNRTSTALSSVVWHLYEKTPQREVTSDRVEVFSHAVLDLMAKPNSFMTGPNLFERSQQHQDLTGEAYWIVAKNKRFPLPLELWPVMPHRMEPVPSSTRFLAGWMYTGPNGEQIPLNCDEVIPNHLPHPRDPYRGLGPVQAMLTQLDSARYSVEWNRNFFANSAQPGGIIQVSRRLGDDEWDEMVNRWNEQHRGVSRAHRVAVIEEAEWVTNQQTMVDMQFAELQTQSRDRLLEAFGMSGSVLGVTEDVNRANAEAGKAMFAELLTEPRAVRWRGVLNNLLLPMYGSTTAGLEFDFDSPVPADIELDNASRTSKSNAASVLVAAGWKPDDVLQAVELPPMEYVGAPAVVAAQAAQAAAEAQRDAAGAAGPDEGQDGQGGGGSGDDDGDEGTGPDAPKDGPAARRLRNADPGTGQDPNQPPPPPANPDLTAVDEQWQAAIAVLLAHYLGEIVPAQRATLLDQIRAHVDAGKPTLLGSLTVDTAAGRDLITQSMTAYAAQAAAQAVSEAIRQGAVIQAADVPDADLEPIATVTAAVLGRDMATDAGRAAMRVTTPASTGDQVVQAVREALAEASTAATEAQLGGALSAAQNKARIATFTKTGNDRAELIATEVLDKNTCPPCEEENGHSFGYTDDPDTALSAHMEYPAGGYVGCQGWQRCRGTVHAIYTPQEGTAG